MKESPILFSSPMVRAILAGTKTQTRRLFFSTPAPCAAGPTIYGRGMPKGLAAYDGDIGASGLPLACSLVSGCLVEIPCPFGVAGDRLVVLEGHAVTIGEHSPRNGRVNVRYLADGTRRTIDVSHAVVDGLSGQVTVQKDRGRPGRFMPRWLSRIALEITDVRVEQLQAITDEDIRAEGVDRAAVAALVRKPTVADAPLRDLWRLGWDAINGEKCPWSANPFVWVVSFRRIAPVGAAT